MIPFEFQHRKGNSFHIWEKDTGITSEINHSRYPEIRYQMHIRRKERWIGVSLVVKICTKQDSLQFKNKLVSVLWQLHTDPHDGGWCIRGHTQLPTLDWPQTLHIFPFVRMSGCSFPLYRLLPLSAVSLKPSGKRSYQRQFVEVRYLIGMGCMAHNISDKQKNNIIFCQTGFLLNWNYRFLLPERLMKV